MFHATVNAISMIQHIIQNKNEIIKLVNVNVKIIISAKKIKVGILAHVFVKIVFKKVANTSVTKFDEIVFVMNNLSTKKTSTTGKNVTNTASISCHSKTFTYCHILHTVLLEIMLLLIITIICYHYAKKKDNIKWKIINFKKFVLKIVRIIISMT